MKFEIHNSASAAQPYYWRMVASNGQVLATSETYTTKQGCHNAIATVKAGAAAAATLDTTGVTARW